MCLYVDAVAMKSPTSKLPNTHIDTYHKFIYTRNHRDLLGGYMRPTYTNIHVYIHTIDNVTDSHHVHKYLYICIHLCNCVNIYM